MISQSIPQLVSSAITIVSVFTSMCLMSWQLTVVTMMMVALMLFYSKKITAMSGKYFVAPVSYTHLDVYKRQICG